MSSMVEYTTILLTLGVLVPPHRRSKCASSWVTCGGVSAVRDTRQHIPTHQPGGLCIWR